MTGKPGDMRKADWRVADVDLSLATRLVRAHHYARGGANTATYLHGIFPVDAFWNEHAKGVAWWIPPTKDAARALAGAGWEGVLALSRLVVEPDVPRNACTFLVSRSIKMIDRARWPVLVTYADEWRGHKGGIYKGCGFVLDGRTKPEAVYTIKGRMMGRKRGPRTYTHAEMLAAGAVFEGRFAKLRYVMRAPA